MSTNDPRNAGSPYRSPLEAQLVEPPRSNVLGIVGLVLSILGLITCGLVSPFGVICSGMAVFKRPRTAAGLGLVIGLAGCILAVVVGTQVAQWTKQTSERFQVLVTEIQAEEKARKDTGDALKEARKAIHDWQTEHTGELPDLKTGQELIADLRDGWHQPLEFQLKESTFDIRSAGKDELPDTNDDMHASDYPLPKDPKTADDSKTEKLPERDDD